MRDRSGWGLGAKRQLDPRDPFPAPAGPDVGWWLHACSATDSLAASMADTP